ncbi:MAG: c-type cytochrome [Planctomycetota bacterium]
MPVTTDTLYSIPRLNRWFAFSAVVALVASVWMLWHDFNRPWRHTQRGFFDLRSAMAHFDALSYQSPAEQENRAKLKSAVAEAEKELASPELKAQEHELLAAEKLLTGQSQAISLDFGNRNAELQVKLFVVEEAKTLHGMKDPTTIALTEDYDQSARVVADLKKRQDLLEDDIRDKKSKLKALYKKKSDAQKSLKAYEKGLDDAERLDSMYGPGFSRMAFNIPGLDYLAPSGVPGREEVQQVFMKGIRFNYNFLDSYVTDRCITCHVGIDNPAYSMESFVKKTEGAIGSEAVRKVLELENQRLIKEFTKRLAEVDVSEFTASGKTLDEAGRRKFVGAMVDGANEYLRGISRPEIKTTDVLPRFVDKPLSRGAIEDQLNQMVRDILFAVAPKAADGKTVMRFEQMDERRRVDYFTSLLAATNTYLEYEGRPKVDLKAELRAHPHLDLYLSPNSSHPMKTMGCTVCHEGSGQETDFVFAAHTPKDKAEEHKWEEQYYVRELGIPLATFHLIEEFWERPMLLPGYTSASCRKCHQQTYDLERRKTEPLESAHRVVDGRDLFTTVGCINCHAVEGLNDSRRVGTDLTHVGSKLSTGFMERWVEYPKNFRPSTWMPHFFKQENNLPSSANEFDTDPTLRTETEIQSIVQYLQTFSKPFVPMAMPQGLTGDAKRGEELFTSVGCLACHANLDAKDSLDDAGRSLGERWIVADMVQSQGLSSEEAKKRFDLLSKNDRIRYAMHNFTKERRDKATEARKEEDRAADREGREPDPKRSYVPPVYTRVAPDLSGLGTKFVQDANDPQAQVKATEWLYSWLREPRHYSSYTRMPRLFRENVYWSDDPATGRKKTDQDILDVAAYLLSLRNDEFVSQPIADDAKHQDMAQGLILDLLGGQNTAAVSKRILNDEKNSPDDAFGRLSSAIVAQTYRSFGDGAAGKSHVAALLSQHAPTLADRQKLYLGMKMVGHYGCYSCHTIAGFEDATRPGTDLTLWAEKFMSQLDFAFYSPPFEEELEKQHDVFGNVYIEKPEFEHLARDGGNQPTEVLHNHASFAYHKLRNPRIWDRKKIKKPYEKLKMPNFFLKQEEARSLVSYLLSLRQPNVAKDVQIPYDRTPAGKIAKGRALVRELNCIGCHTIEGNDANIHQYYSTDTNLSDTDPRSLRFKPPLLWGEGAKVQFNWLYSFLNNVEMLRPWLNARMPSFYLTKEQTTTLVEYFAGLAQDESRILRKDLEGVLKHLQETHGGDKAAAATSQWFTDEKFTQQASFLKRYALNKQQTGPLDFQPSANTPEEMNKGLAGVYDRVVGRGSFLANVFNVEYPFTDPNKHSVGDVEFKQGEEFFFNLKCLSCHVAGDPKVPGTTTDIKAPNFALTAKRLRYDWVVAWLQDPQSIQPGANMPQIFQGGSAFSASPAEDRAKQEAKFGKGTEEQARLLVDFLYTLGERNYTAIQPGGAAPAAPAGEPAKGGDFDFDSGDGAAAKPGQPTSQPAKQDFDF